MEIVRLTAGNHPSVSYCVAMGRDASVGGPADDLSKPPPRTLVPAGQTTVRLWLRLPAPLHGASHMGDLGEAD